MSKLQKLSIIITTYNRPDTLAIVLDALSVQTNLNFEVIIADDGSTDDTKELINKIEKNFPVPLHHVWQIDEGFQAAKIRNKAVAKANTNYLIFLDGDCVPLPSFVARHSNLAKQKSFVVGNRVLLTEHFTQQTLQTNLAIYTWTFFRWLVASLQNKCNRILPLVYLPLGSLRDLRAEKWRGAKTCNLAMWRDDFIAVNGFDEAYQGWGYEDSDLVIRLLNHGAKRREGRFAVPVIHLWHPENDRSLEGENLARLKDREHSQIKSIEQGVSQYLL